MRLKKCYVQNCKSSSTRNEDKGVTYHKFPKDAYLRDKWTVVAHFPPLKLVPCSFVCSRHFCKRDFVKNKDSKYVLKSDAIPSIFPWKARNMEVTQLSENYAEPSKEAIEPDKLDNANISGSSKSSEVENIDNIKKFIESQVHDMHSINTNKTSEKYHNTDNDKIVEKPDESIEIFVSNLEMKFENLQKHVNNAESSTGNGEMSVKNVDEKTLAAPSVMEMILSDTEVKTLKRNTIKEIPKQTLNSGNNTMPLSVGSKVEAKDFSEEWYPAEISEVDFDEMEVLVHYYKYVKKPDEWISVSSPRLRPFTGTSEPKPEEKQPELKEVKEDIKDIKAEDKTKLYVVGERCLARWRDNRRFVATIDKDLGDGKFEVIFDDGFHWACSISRLSKLKDTRDVLTIDTTLPSTSGAPSPILQGGPSSGSPSPIPTFHTHLFDPTRDYLGSKSERREKKRKLNIKEIFNIGQKKQKMSKVEKEKVPKQKKLVKKTVKPKAKLLESKDVKCAIPDAVASIIGSGTTTTVNDTTTEIKEKHKGKGAMEVDESNNVDQLDESTDSKSDSDPVDEEDKLERFDKPDQVMHEEVMDKMKEAISKLEGGLKEEIDKAHSPKVDWIDSPKPVPDVKPVIESLTTVTSLPIPVTSTPTTVSNTQETVTETSYKVTETKSVIETKTEHIDIPIETAVTITETVDADVETSTAGIETSITDADVLVEVPSPSLIDTSEADFEKIMPDDDSTKSDIEMGCESPRLDIDSQPILVDIDAPLDIDAPIDNDLPESQELIVKKHKKLKIKDFAKPKKKAKKEQKKKLFYQKLARVNKYETELAEMKLKMRELMLKFERDKQQVKVPMPESCLVGGEWACRWVNGQPVGKVSEMEGDAKPDTKPDAAGRSPLPRRSVEVIDKRLPEGWTKHMVRRSVGHSAGKWDVVLVSPANRRFHTKSDMRNFLETADEATKAYEHALMDFGVHLKLARKLGWICNTPDGVAKAPETILPADSNSSLSPLVKRKTLSLKRKADGLKSKDKAKKRPIKLKLQRRMHTYNSQLVDAEGETSATMLPEPLLLPALEDGYVWVGSLKVQVIDNLLRCPAEGCFKNFRNNTLLQMHIKHYHRELRKMMGATPKVLDLAAARSKPTMAELSRTDPKVFKVKINRPPKREEPKLENLYSQEQDKKIDDIHSTPVKDEILPKIPRSQDSPKLRNALIHKPIRRPKVLLPMRRTEPQQTPPNFNSDDDFENTECSTPPADVLDFETAISTHTVTKPLDKKKKGDKKQKSFASFAKNISEDEELFAMNSDDLDTRLSFPRSGTPDDSKVIDPKTGMVMSSDPMDDQLDPSLYTFTETGERIKIVHMKREEIINCHCGFREEDGLMVQCELCLCWQHALCHNIQKESEVPEKYTCSICLNPRRGRRSKRFVHDQDRLYEGLLPGARPDDSLRRSHELAGNLLRIEDALHALRVKCYCATKKDHPKLYLWAKDWEQAEVPYKLHSEYSDLSIMINGMDKENLPLKPEETPQYSDLRTTIEEDPDSDRYSQRDGQLGSQALLSGLLSSPSTASLDLPISTSELERLAKSVQEAAVEWQGQATASAPQPEAAIENDACRERLLKHIQCCQALLDSRLDSIEAQVAELESQDPSFGEHYETAEHYPRIKQTVQMLLRDLDTMEELGVIT